MANHGRSQGVDDDQLTALAGRIVQEIFKRRWVRYVKGGGLQADIDEMSRYAREQELAGNGRWRRVYAMTPRMYELLNLMKPDGVDWDKNADFKRFMVNTPEFEYLKKNPLFTVDPTELGYKEKKDESSDLRPVSAGAAGK